MPLTVPMLVNLPKKAPLMAPVVDLGLPNYDRNKDRGNYLLFSLNNGTIESSSYCSSFSKALAMTRLSKRHATWVVHGLEDELVNLQVICSMKADWLTPKIVDNLIRSYLGKSLEVVTTTNF